MHFIHSNNLVTGGQNIIHKHNKSNKLQNLQQRQQMDPSIFSIIDKRVEEILDQKDNKKLKTRKGDSRNNMKDNFYSEKSFNAE